MLRSSFMSVFICFRVKARETCIKKMKIPIHRIYYNKIIIKFQ
jgi:hypothetical protein